jgi:prophage regulatory protein
MSLLLQGDPNMATEQTTVILRLPELRKRIGLGRSSIYALVKQGSFPRPIPLSRRAVGWLQSDIEQWIAERAAKRVKD